MDQKTKTSTREMLIKSDMLIGEVVEKYPQTAYVMTSFGLHCVGCHVNPYETLEQGALGHGMPKEMFEEMIKEVNKIAENGLTAEEKVHEPKEEKVYITGFAAQKVAEFMKKDRKEGAGLRLSASPGGCAGYQYALEFDKPTEQDIVFEEHGVQLIVAKKQLEMLAGIKIDFVDGLSGTGFKIENPNAAGSCGCGKSFH